MEIHSLIKYSKFGYSSLQVKVITISLYGLTGRSLEKGYSFLNYSYITAQWVPLSQNASLQD